MVREAVIAVFADIVAILLASSITAGVSWNIDKLSDLEQPSRCTKNPDVTPAPSPSGGTVRVAKSFLVMTAALCLMSLWCLVGAPSLNRFATVALILAIAAVGVSLAGGGVAVMTTLNHRRRRPRCAPFR